MKKFGWSSLLLIVVVGGLSGCGNKSETASPAGSTTSYPLPDPPLVATCPPGIPGGRLVIATPWDPKTFNPITQNEESSIDITRLMFAAMLGFDVPSQQVEPGLADWWTNSPDGKTWTFHLRKELRWSDGAPLTADDVVFTCNDIIYNTNIDNVTRDALEVDGKIFTVTNLDDSTIRVVTPEVYAPFLANFGAGVTILPKHVLAKAVADGTFLSAYGINWKPQDIVCSGPFRLKEYKPAQYTLLERNPYFCEVDSNGQRLPYLENVVYTVVPNLNAQNLGFLSGESDAVDFIHADAYDQFKAAAAKGNFKLEEPGIGLETTFFFFNENTNDNPKTGKPYVDPIKLNWFRDVKFRQACSYAINREAIVKAVYAGRAVPNYGFVTPGNKKWYNPNIKTYPYDPAKALALLKEIGIEHRNADGILEDARGHPIEFVLNTNTGNDTRGKMAVMIQSDLDKLGFKVVLQPIEFNTLINKVDVTYDYECVLIGLGGGSTDPGSSMNVLKSSGFTHQWFPRQKTPSTPWEARIDQLMDAQMRTLNFAERKRDFDEVQEILAEEQPIIFTVTPYYYGAIRSDIGNVRPTALEYHRVTWNAEELYFKH
jgi:peptide/nickel transport system substrate-binding protein